MEIRKPRVYISGPISGHDLEERRKTFKEVQQMLESMGFRPFNPMENGLPECADTHSHMRRDLNELTRRDDPYDIIFMMERWTHSAGCWKEFETAVSCGITVIFEEMDLKKGINLHARYAGVRFQ